MNLKEYETQLALGTVNFRLAANKTQSSTVLQDIIGRTDDIAVLVAVATNLKSNIYTLTLLATFPNADEGVIISCAYHPNVTLSVLERWMKYPSIECIQAVQQRVRALQLASGVPEKDALVVREIPSLDPDLLKGMWHKYYAGDKNAAQPAVYPAIPDSQRAYVVWTTSGNNVTIEMDDSRFKFATDPDDTAVYYSYDSDVSVPKNLKWTNADESH